MASDSLRGLPVLVTRPAPQADAICQMLSARGAEVERLPLQSIEPVRQSALTRSLLDAAHEARYWIFTSANAVHFAAALDDVARWPTPIAVGQATAVALERLGCVPRVPSGAHSSEALLGMPELATVAGARIAIVSGEGGRELLAETLRTRGAEVQRIAVYRRVALPLSAAVIEAALACEPVVLLTSGEALRHLLASADARQRRHLLALQLVVPSQRVVEEALNAGFTHTPLRPDQVSDAAYVNCLEHWRAAQQASSL